MSFNHALCCTNALFWMNYLAHIYLSGDTEEIILGNFIGDYVKGNKYQQYPECIAYGIMLHRSIDSFTDQHRDVKSCIDLLKPDYGRYAGIVVDIFFDHFLAANWNQYSAYSLRDFAKRAHAVFLSNFRLLPFKVKQFLPFFIQHKRFESYAQINNIRQVLDIMSKRTSLPAKTDQAIHILTEEYSLLESLFRSFFEEMINYVESNHGIHISKPSFKNEA